jgi:hypothetical protein
MACAEALTLYKNRDNAVTIVPYSDFSEAINYDMTDTIKVVANADLVGSTTVGDSIEIDSNHVSNAVAWTNDNPSAEWRIYCKVGLFPAIAAGTYTLRITIYDAEHPNGLVLPDTDSALLITIVDLP